MIQFTKPLYLLLMLPLGYYSWRLSKQSFADLSHFRSRLALGLRLLILAMLVLSLAGTRMVRNAAQQCVVFAIDVSDSVPKTSQDAAIRYINESLRNLRSDQKAGIVAFGSDAAVELAPSNVSKIDKIYSIPGASQTDISQALGLALASFPEQCSKKIVLLSDGNETIGKSIEQAMLAGSNDVSIDVVPVGNDLLREALLDKMICPNNVKVGEPFDLKVIALSKQPTSGTIRILRNGAPVGSKPVELTKGRSVFTFQQSIDKPGNYEFKAILDCDDDTRTQNNVSCAYTMVRGKPRILYVEGQAGQEQYLTKALSSSDIVVDVRNRSGIPTTLAQMQGYDVVILSDVPAWNLTPEQMGMIKSGVKDLGIGFAMIGGENSFGSGGYYDTPIEETLPVNMSVRKTKVLPTLAVMIVMDKSGSMGEIQDGVEKIRLANDAASSVVKLLHPIDQVGVIVCHSFPVAAVKLQSAKNKGPIYSEISTIRAEGGGIAVFPSMKMANDMISRADTRQKHVILLADGNDCDGQDGVVPLVKQMASHKVTVTAVAIGDGQHVPFLKAVAATGKGGFYLTLRARDLKAIFTKDVMTISKSLVVEEPFIPRIDPSSPELAGISAAPPLLGYIATDPKPAARTYMVSHKNDPILSTWQYGLGKSIAFTSDCKARWAARWLSWPDYSKFWAQVIRSAMRRSGSSDFQTTVDISGGTGRLVVDAVDDKGNFLNLLKFSGSVVGPDMKGRPVAIEQTGPGRYEGTFDARDPGSYVVNVGKKGGQTISPEVNVVSVPYSPEYKDLSPNTALLRRLASETSGTFSPSASDVFTRHFRLSRTYTDLWRLLVLLAALVLPFEIAIRRLSVSPEQVVEIYEVVRERIKRRAVRKRTPKVMQREESLNTLLQTKKERVASIKHEIPTIPVASPSPSPKPEEPKPKPEPEKKTDSPTQASTASRLLEAKKRAREKRE